MGRTSTVVRIIYKYKHPQSETGINSVEKGIDDAWTNGVSLGSFPRMSLLSLIH